MNYFLQLVIKGLFRQALSIYIFHSYTCLMMTQSFIVAILLTQNAPMFFFVLWLFATKNDGQINE